MPGTTAYPGGLDDDTNLPDDNVNADTSEDLHPELHNNANAAIRAIQAELGTNPSAGESTVSARIAAVEGATGAAFLECDTDQGTVTGTAFGDAAADLDIAVTNGVTVRFQYIVSFVTNATTTGGGFALTGPAITRLVGRISQTVSNLGAISTPAAFTTWDEAPPANTGADATNNLCIIEGLLVPAADGTLKLRAKAEIASPGSVTVKAGSSVLYW